MKYQVKEASDYEYVKLIRSGWENAACDIKAISSNLQCHA
jgi:hypothetical protein